MGAKGVKIIKERGDFVKKLVKQHGMTQLKLALEIPVAPENLSSILNGKRALSADIAERIASIFKGEITANWLMGYDDFKTEAERISYIVRKNYSQIDLIQNLITLHGYTIMDVTDEDGYQSKKVEDSPEKADEERREYKEPMIEISSPQGAKRYLSRQDFKGLLKLIDDYTEMQMLFLFRKLGDGAKEYWG